MEVKKLKDDELLKLHENLLDKMMAMVILSDGEVDLFAELDIEIKERGLVVG